MYYLIPSIRECFVWVNVVLWRSDLRIRLGGFPWMPIHLITTTFVKYPFHYHDGAEIVPRQNPRPRRSIFPPIPGFIKCKGIQVCPAKRESSSNGVVGVGDWKSKEKEKEIDVATLGNLCVDIVLNVPELPPKNPAHRKPYMDRLSASPPDKVFRYLYY